MILDLLFPRRCYICGKTGSYFHPYCRQNLNVQSLETQPPVPFDGRLSLFKYHGPIRHCLNDLKYKFISHLHQDLSSLVCGKITKNFPHLLSYWQDQDYNIVPIPLHPFRQNWRGFNQSIILAQSIASRLKLALNPKILSRILYTPPQVKLTKRQRIKNVNRAFRLNLASPIPKNIILFDDVSTTGATLQAAALTFPKNYTFWALTIAG